MNSKRTTIEAYGGVALLGLASLPGEDNKLGLVDLQPLNVDLLSLLARVPPSVVNNDSDTPGLLLSDTSLLKLSERESATFAEFSVVAHSLATDCRAKQRQWSDAEGSSLSFAGIASAELASWLVEPGAYATLPIFTEMVSGEDCRISLSSTVEHEKRGFRSPLLCAKPIGRSCRTSR